jgi:hypothetical protein
VTGWNGTSQISPLSELKSLEKKLTDRKKGLQEKAVVRVTELLNTPFRRHFKRQNKMGYIKSKIYLKPQIRNCYAFFG